MSMSVISAINDAALRVGDPQFATVSRDQWLSFMNSVCREIAQQLRMVKWVADANVVSGVEIYKLPSDCVTLTRLQFNPLPGAQGWRDLGEMFQDQYRAATNHAYPTGEPSRYFVDGDYILLDKIPGITVIGGLRASYWGLPQNVSSYSATDIPLPDTIRDFMVRGMVVESLVPQQRLEEYAQQKFAWQEQLISKRDRMEDRGGDKRSRLRPASASMGGLT